MAPAAAVASLGLAEARAVSELGTPSCLAAQSRAPQTKGLGPMGVRGMVRPPLPLETGSGRGIAAPLPPATRRRRPARWTPPQTSSRQPSPRHPHGARGTCTALARQSALFGARNRQQGQRFRSKRDKTSASHARHRSHRSRHAHALVAGSRVGVPPLRFRDVLPTTAASKHTARCALELRQARPARGVRIVHRPVAS